jgi:hypothetical protein
MTLLELPGWQLEYDHAATKAAYGLAPNIGPSACNCDPCRNWAATRVLLLPTEFRLLLERFGVPIDREAEVYHMGRLNSGLHLYGAWYHLVGRVLSGELEDSPFVQMGTFSVFFHSKPALLPDAFANDPVVQLEATAEVPWLSDIPESP